MNKRQQYQLAQANSKLEQYHKNLSDLLLQKNNLESNLERNLESNLESTLEKYKNFEQARIEKINVIELCSKEIIKLRNEHIITIDSLKYLPRTLENNLEIENNIYNEECLHLKLKQIDAQEIQTQQLQQQVLDKQMLENEINSNLKLINTASENIINIQAEAHGFRKNTIAQLQANKQQKKLVSEQINILQCEELHIKEIINNLETEKILLLEYKKQIIDNHYANINQNPILKLLSSKIDIVILDINIDTNLNIHFDNNQLNTIINIIDSRITNYTIQLEQIYKQSTKTTLRNQQSIKLLLFNNMSKDISKDNTKVICYKDNFKQAKIVKYQLEEKQKELEATFNNWENYVIKTINDNYNEILKQIDNDKSRAKERLDIMTARFHLDFETKKKQLENEINILADKLLNTNTTLTNAKKELQEINLQIEKEQNNQKELTNINSKIEQTKKAIQIIELDISSITN